MGHGRGRLKTQVLENASTEKASTDRKGGNRKYGKEKYKSQSWTNGLVQCLLSTAKNF